jgi:hypothetical protein
MGISLNRFVIVCVHVFVGVRGGGGGGFPYLPFFTFGTPSFSFFYGHTID